jgi:hypothetical protein
MILAEWSQVTKRVTELSEDSCLPFVRNVFLELAAAKLGVERYLPEGGDFDIVNAHAEVAKILEKAATKIYKKWASASGAGALAGLSAVLPAQAELKVEKGSREQKPPSAKAATGAAELLQPVVAEGQDGGEVQPAADEGQAAMEAPPAAVESHDVEKRQPAVVLAGKEVTQADVSIGMEILVIAGQHKEKYHNMKATIKSASLASLRVVLLEGPAEGEELKRTYKQVRFFSPPRELVASLPAGSGKRPATQEEDPDAKRQRGSAKALAILGDLGDVR